MRKALASRIGLCGTPIALYFWHAKTYTHDLLVGIHDAQCFIYTVKQPFSTFE
jgi:hypothetical protein